MDTYHKINAPFKRDMTGEITGQKGKLMVGDWALPEFEYLADNEWEFTEKVDGTNIRIEFGNFASLDAAAWAGVEDKNFGVEFGGRTNNAVIPKPLMEYLQDTFTCERFVDAQLKNITLYGEGYGPKIQGGGKYRGDHSFVLFDVKIGDFWLSRDNVNDIADKLGIESVPVLGKGSLWQAINYVKFGTPYHNKEIEAIRKSSDRDWLSEEGGMNSTWGNFEAEGIVARPVVPLFNRKGERIITKIKAVDFR